jgi:gluconolactonase
MAVDSQGNLWVAAGVNFPRAGAETLDTRAGVYVFAPDGRIIRTIPVLQDLITNVAFGGTDRRTVYITAGNTVFSVASDIAGTRR